MNSYPNRPEPPSSEGSFANNPVLPAAIMFAFLAGLLLILLRDVPRVPITVAEATLEITEEVAAVEAAELVVTVEPTEAVAEPVAVAQVDPAIIAQGESLYMGTCMACHGMNAEGVIGLGKDLVYGEYTNSVDDETLVHMIIVGRQPWDEGNTTGIAMPARGGNPSLTDDQIRSIVAYLRSLAPETASTEGTVVEVVPTATTVPATATPVPTTASAETLAPTAVPATLAPLPTAGPRTGAQIFAWSCAGCHGLDGEGTTYFGPAITDSELLADEEALHDLILNGGEPVDPALGFTHPYRGGNPPLTDEEINTLLEYLESLP